MKKIAIFSVFAACMLIFGQPAWADGGYGHDHDHNNDFRVFRKIVHVLDDVLNDDFGHEKKVVVVTEKHYSRKVCKIKHRHKHRHHHRYSHH